MMSEYKQIYINYILFILFLVVNTSLNIKNSTNKKITRQNRNGHKILNKIKFGIKTSKIKNKSYVLIILTKYKIYVANLDF